MSLLPPTTTTLALAAIVLIAFIVEAAIGFGATVVAVTFSSLLLPIGEVLPAFVAVNVLLSAAMLARHHEAIAWCLLAREVAPAVLVGLASGLLLLGRGVGAELQLAFALFVVALSSAELLRSTTRRAPRAGALFLALGGAAHGLFGCGGPMIVYAMRRRLDDERALRASLALVWLVLNAALLARYVSVDLVGARTAALGLALVITVVPALLVGDRLAANLRGPRFGYAVFGALFLAGAVLAVRTALSLHAAPPRHT